MRQLTAELMKRRWKPRRAARWRRSFEALAD